MPSHVHTKHVVWQVQLIRGQLTGVNHLSLNEYVVGLADKSLRQTNLF